VSEKLTFLERAFAEGKERPVWIQTESKIAIEAMGVGAACIEFVRRYGGYAIEVRQGTDWPSSTFLDDATALVGRIEAVSD
jgi:hypothetical protein